MAFTVTGSTTIADVRDGAPGNAGGTGPTGPRAASREIWSLTANANAPALPTNDNATYSFANGTFSGTSFNTTNGPWTNNPPTEDASAANRFWTSATNSLEANFGGTVSSSFASARQTTVFTGIVRFTNANEISDGTDNRSFGNLSSANTVNTAQVTGAGNLISANAVNASNQVNGAGNLITANAVNTGQVTGAGNLISQDNVNTAQVTGAGNLISANAVDAANQINGTLPNARLNSSVSLQGNVGSLFTNTTTIDGGQINTGRVQGGTIDANTLNGAGFALNAGTSGGAFFVGNSDNQYLRFNGNTFEFNGPVSFSNVNGTDNVTLLGNNNTNIRNTIGAGTGNGNGNSNLNNANVSINAVNQTTGDLPIANRISGTGNLATANSVAADNQITGTLPNARLSSNVTLAGNTGSLFTNTTVIDGGQINTGEVRGGNANWTSNQTVSGTGFALRANADGNSPAGSFFVGNAANQYLSFDGSTFTFNGSVNFSNQVNATTNITLLGNNNTNIRNTIGAGTGNSNLNNANVSINVVNQTSGDLPIANRITGTGNLATANAVNTAQVNGAGNLISANAVNASNQVNGAGNLITANAVDAGNQVNGTLPNARLNNSVNDVVAAVNDNTNGLATRGTGNGNGNSNLNNANVSIGATQINAGVLANTVSINTASINAGFLNDARLSRDNVTIQGNGGSLFSGETIIDGGQISTGLISTQFLFVDSALALTGPNSGFLAGRTSLSDFGTDGFYIGRSSTDGVTADGFQLSHTSVTGADSLGAAAPFTISPSDTGTLNGINIQTGQTYRIRTVNANIPQNITVDFRPIGGPLVDQSSVGVVFTATGQGVSVANASFVGVTLLEPGLLTSGTVQGVIHDDIQGLRIYEPIFYQRGSVSASGDSILTGSGNLTLNAGSIHTVTLQGGGGGGGGGSAPQNSSGPTTSTNSNFGNAGGTTNANLSGYSAGSYNGNNTFSAGGGAGGAPGLTATSSGSGGGSGANSSFGSGGEGGNAVGTSANAGSAPASTAYGAAGGGGGGPARDFGFGGSPTSGLGGVGGSVGQDVSFTVDLTNSNNNATLAVTVGAGGNGGNGAGGGNGGAGRQGTAAVSDVLDGYTPTSLSDLAATGYWEPGGSRTNLNINDARNQVFSVSGGTNGQYGYLNVRTNGTLNTGVYAINGSNSWHAQADGNRGSGISNGPVDVNVGRSGFTWSGWAHIAPGSNLVFQQSQSLGFTYTFWPLA